MRAILLLAALASLALPGGAEGCVPTSSSPEIDTRTLADGAGARYYVENDPGQPCCWSFWIYEESNGIDGLQRRDEQRDDTCGGQIPGDTVIF